MTQTQDQTQIPAGVQEPVVQQSVVQQPVVQQPVVQIPPELQEPPLQVQPMPPQPQPQLAPPQPSFVDAWIEKGVKAVASMTGNPDPVTGEGGKSLQSGTSSASAEPQKGFFGKFFDGAKNIL